MGNFFCNKTRVVPIVFIQGKPLPPDEECSICLREFQNNNNFEMPCGHNFHDDCILDWFDKKKNCPLCRQPFKWALEKNMKITNKYKNGNIVKN